MTFFRNTTLFFAAVATLCLAPSEAKSQAPTQATTAPASMPAQAQPKRVDQALERAEAYVAKSDKYLHHSKLKRGMKGYGLTVMAGTKIERFEAEIVSVMYKWGPHQDVVLAKLKGLNLETSGIIAGMSGSPVYVIDPADGKEKMIGAVAYGWSAPKEPLCGIQPITQMLAISGVLDEPGVMEATTQSSPANSAGPKPADSQYLKRALDPRKIDFTDKKKENPAGRSVGPEMVALKTPMMISGIRGDMLGRINQELAPMGIVAVQSGSAGAGDVSPQDLKLQPGSGIAIPLASGDADWAAVGTVTEVIGDKVLAFGHSFFSEGKVELPMGPAYIHTVVAGVVDSFKLGSPILEDPRQKNGMTGTGILARDETVGIAGVIGKRVDTIPMTVQVDLAGKEESRTFHYNVVRHNYLSGLLVYFLLQEACMGWYHFPEEHSLQYSVDVDFGKFGRYKTANVSSQNYTNDIASDLLRPIAVLANNPWSVAPPIKSINVQVTVHEGARVSQVQELKLAGKVYRPGEKVTGVVVLDPFRHSRREMPVELDLPSDLPEGQYELTVSDSIETVRCLQQDSPQRFDPQSVAELFDVVQAVVQAKTDCLYLRLQLPQGGLAMRGGELPDLPASRFQMLSQSQKRQTYPYTRALTKSIQGECVFSGSAKSSFEVRKQPKEVLVREQEIKGKQ